MIGGIHAHLPKEVLRSLFCAGISREVCGETQKPRMLVASFPLITQSNLPRRGPGNTHNGHTAPPYPVRIGCEFYSNMFRHREVNRFHIFVDSCWSNFHDILKITSNIRRHFACSLAKLARRNPIEGMYREGTKSVV